MNVKTGKFVVSLDFELIWGVCDVVTIQTYGEHLRGVHTVIPKVLQAFRKFDIKGTFATVGFLFFSTKEELMAAAPARKPNYDNPALSPYLNEFKNLGESYQTDPYHYAPQLIKLIQDCPEQEISTHTFCHYYCLEDGQTVDDFREDLRAAVKVALDKNITIKSIIFPRNQFNNEYLEVCRSFGITIVRGNEGSWLYKSRRANSETTIRRAFRLLDTYVNITGQHCYSDEYMISTYPYNIPSSRFLRPYNKKTRLLEPLRLRRIKKGMTHAAKNNLTFHLWWHPHNFGINQDENFNFLEKILTHYQYLNRTYNFTNYTMAELADYLHQKYGH